MSLSGVKSTSIFSAICSIEILEALGTLKEFLPCVTIIPTSFTRHISIPTLTSQPNLPNQLDLFPTSEPEIKGQLAAFAVVLRGLIEALIANGSLTPEQAQTLLRHSDLKTAFAVWDGLQGEMPDAELRR